MVEVHTLRHHCDVHVCVLASSKTISQKITGSW